MPGDRGMGKEGAGICVRMDTTQPQKRMESAICNHMDENGTKSEKCRYCHITYVWDLKKATDQVNITKSSRLTDTQIKGREDGGRGDAGEGRRGTDWPG